MAMKRADWARIPGARKVEVGDVASGYCPQPGEGLPEDEQPQRRLDRPGDQLAAVVAQLLELDEAHGRHPARQLTGQVRAAPRDPLNRDGWRSCGWRVRHGTLLTPRGCPPCSA